MAAQAVRFAGMDGRIEELAAERVEDVRIPLVSDNWEKMFGEKWTAGAPSAAARKKRAALVKQARAGADDPVLEHAGYARGAADAERGGVDLINTDNLAGLRDFLRALRANG